MSEKIRPGTEDGPEFRPEHKNVLTEEPATHRDRTGGRHGETYTETFKLTTTPEPALNELADNTSDFKPYDSPTQRACKSLLKQLAEIGFTREHITKPEFQTLEENIRVALEELYTIKVSSVASTSKFYTGTAFKTLTTAEKGFLSASIKKAIREVFGTEPKHPNAGS